MRINAKGRRGVGAIVAAMTCYVLLQAGPALADTAYPRGANFFTTSAEGWTDAQHDCSLLTIPNAVCEVTNRHTEVRGNPPGALEARYQTVANALGQGVGTSRYVSPSFRVDPAATGDAQFSIDRATEVQALIDSTADTRTLVELVDESDGSRLTLVDAGATGTTPFESLTATVPAAELAGGPLHIEITTTQTTSVLQAAQGVITATYDNVSLRVPDGTPPGPLLETLPATGISSTTATLNGRINPRGRATIYRYQYVAADAPAGTPPTQTAVRSIPEGTNEFLSPVAEPIDGLRPGTGYLARIVALNEDGLTAGNLVGFITPPFGGPAGPQGPAGPPGPGGTGGSGGQDLGSVRSGDRRALLRIDGQRLTVPLRGRDRGRLRIRIFCRHLAVRTCAGEVKVRSRDRINPASRGTRPRRRVTFATDAVQLARGKVGFAILTLNDQRLAVMRRVGSLRVTVTATLIDANNNRQNVTRTATLRVRR